MCVSCVFARNRCVRVRVWQELPAGWRQRVGHKLLSRRGAAMLLGGRCLDTPRLLVYSEPGQSRGPACDFRQHAGVPESRGVTCSTTASVSCPVHATSAPFLLTRIFMCKKKKRQKTCATFLRPLRLLSLWTSTHTTSTALLLWEATNSLIGEDYRSKTSCTALYSIPSSALCSHCQGGEGQSDPLRIKHGMIYTELVHQGYQDGGKYVG